MKVLKNIVLSLFALLLFASCEKEVHISLSSVPPVPVVEGAIQTGLPPIVVITSTLSFFSTIDINSIQSSFIHNANVQVSDGSRTITLREYALDSSGAKYFIYTIDTSNISQVMLGQVNKYYTLRFSWQGKTYSATTKIPPPKPIDSMWAARPQFTDSNTPDSAMEIYVNYTDPDTPGNYVHYFTRRNKGPFFGVGVFNDQLINGTTVKDLPLTLGYQSGQRGNGDSLRYAFPGDVITLNFAAIDKATYDFWNSYYYAQRADGNPFSSPINVKSNLSNGAVGVWAGYGNTYSTITVH